MCMIAFKPAGVMFANHKPLLYGYAKNKNGVGLSIMKSGKQIYTNKTFATFRDFWKFYKANVAKEDIALIHFRYATHGLVDCGNRHPFPVTTDREAIRFEEFWSEDVIAHNGIISNMSKFCSAKDAIHSDTQEFIIRKFAPAIELALEHPVISGLIEDGINGSRLIYMRKDGLIKFWGEWVESDGIYYSNTGFKDRPAKVKKYKGTMYDVQTYGGSYSGYENDWYKKMYRQHTHFKSKGSGKLPAKRCEACFTKEGKEITLTSYNGTLLCKDCAKTFNIEGYLSDTDIESGLDYEISREVCRACKKSSMEVMLYHDMKGVPYCAQCMRDEAKGNKKKETVANDEIVCPECGKHMKKNDPTISYLGFTAICSACYEKTCNTPILGV